MRGRLQCSSAWQICSTPSDIFKMFGNLKFRSLDKGLHAEALQVHEDWYLKISTSRLMEHLGLAGSWKLERGNVGTSSTSHFTLAYLLQSRMSITDLAMASPRWKELYKYAACDVSIGAAPVKLYTEQI